MSGVQFRHRQIVFRKMHVRIARIRFLVCWSPFCLMRQVSFFQVFSQCFQFSWFRVLLEYLNVNRIYCDLLAVKMQQKYTYVWNPFDIYSMRFIHDIHSLTIHASRYQPVDLQAEEEAGWSCWKLWGLWRCRNVRTPKCSKRPSPFGHICTQNICAQRQPHPEIYLYTHAYTHTHTDIHIQRIHVLVIYKQLDTHTCIIPISVYSMYIYI